jgi:hypothetical protein
VAGDDAPTPKPSQTAKGAKGLATRRDRAAAKALSRVMLAFLWRSPLTLAGAACPLAEPHQELLIAGFAASPKDSLSSPSSARRPGDARALAAVVVAQRLPGVLLPERARGQTSTTSR